MDSELARRLSEAIEAGTGLGLATVVSAQGSTPGRVGFKMLVYRDGTSFGTVGGGELEKRVLDTVRAGLAEPSIARFVMSGDPRVPDGTHMICGGVAEVFLEPLGLSDELYVFGGGHVGGALVRVGRLGGFRVIVYDNRPEFASRERHLEANEVISAPYEELGEHVRFGPRTFIAIMTHGHRHDEIVLRACLGRERAYLGCIGSKAKAHKMLARLRDTGVDDDQLHRIDMPIGLDIGSQAAGEIAISIIAQIMAVRRGHDTLAVHSTLLSGT